MKINIDYKTLSTEEKGVKELVRTFKKKGAEIVAIDVPDKVKKTSGVAYKELFLTFADSQQVALRISEKNAIFQVMINNRLTPIKNQDDHDKAVIEMIDLMDAGRKAFTKKLEARAMEVPLEEKTSTSAMRVELQAKRDGLKESIASLESELVELHAAHETSAAQDELKQTKDDIPIATIPEVNQTATEQPTVQPEPIVLTGEEPEYVDDESDEPEQPSNDTSSLVTEFADKVSKTSVQRSKIINKLNAISNKNTDLTNAQWLQKAVDAGKDVLRGMVDQYKVYKIEYEFAQFLKGDLPDLKPSVSDKVKKVTVGVAKNTPTEQPAAVPAPTEQPAAEQDDKVQAALNSQAFKSAVKGISSSLATIAGIDAGTEKGYDRKLFVSSIVGKIKTQAKNNPLIGQLLLAKLDVTQQSMKKPAVTMRHSVWELAQDWEQYRSLFEASAQKVEPAAVNELTNDQLQSAIQPVLDIISDVAYKSRKYLTGWMNSEWHQYLYLERTASQMRGDLDELVYKVSISDVHRGNVIYLNITKHKSKYEKLHFGTIVWQKKIAFADADDLAERFMQALPAMLKVLKLEDLKKPAPQPVAPQPVAPVAPVAQQEDTALTTAPAPVQPARFSPEIEAILSKKSEQEAPPREEAIQWLNSVIAGTQSDAIGSVEFSDKFIAILEEYEPLHDDMYPLLEKVSAMEDEVVESILMDSI